MNEKEVKVKDNDNLSNKIPSSNKRRYFEITNELLSGEVIDTNKLHNLQLDKHLETSTKKPCVLPNLNKQLIDVLIDDLNEMDRQDSISSDFSVSLPKEIVLKIYSYLDINSLCSCSLVNKCWKTLANDCFLWKRFAHKFGMVLKEKYDKTVINLNYKEQLSEFKKRLHICRKNWSSSNHREISLNCYQGGVLRTCCSTTDLKLICSVYSNGDVKLWNFNNDSFDDKNFTLFSTPIFPLNLDDTIPVSASCCTINEEYIVVGYGERDIVNILSIKEGKFLGSCKLMGGWNEFFLFDGIKFVAISKNNYALFGNKHVLSIQQISLLEDVEENDDGIKILSTTNKLVSNTRQIKCLEDDIFIVDDFKSIRLFNAASPLNPEKATSELKLPLGASTSAFFSLSNFNQVYLSYYQNQLNMHTSYTEQSSYQFVVYDMTKNFQPIRNFQAPQATIDCIHSSERNPNICCIGSRDRLIRIYDHRYPLGPTKVFSSCRHVSSKINFVQMDDYKLVSTSDGADLFVWDLRNGKKLWEIFHRHPLGYVYFTDEYMVCASIPSVIAEAELNDNMVHLRDRGSINLMKFSDEF